MNSWNVVVDGQVIDTVFYHSSCDADYVRRTLIEHDGYPGDIEVELEIDD